MLQVNHITKKYKNFTALKDITLTFDHGIYGLLAPNGAGKTTLMKMLVTLLFPTEGSILYNGEDILKMDGAYRKKVGFLPQDFGYYKDYSPKRYLKYLGVIKGMKRTEIEERTEAVLEMVGLSDVKNKKMKQFSGGMIQRVGIAQALLDDPEILILDEPTAGLDPKERQRFRRILTSLSREKTVIISTHIVSDIEFIANHIVIIKNKQILCNASVEELCGRLEGMVYETEMDAGALDDFEKKYSVVSQRQEGRRSVVRFICGDTADEGWSRCAPELEDVFLYMYRE